MTYKPCLIFFVALLFSACTQHYYQPAIYKNDIAYQAKPLSTDAVKTANYISGGLSLGSGVDANDNIYSGRISFDRAHTFDNLNVAYGAFGFAGSYENTSVDATNQNYFDTKSFAGLGAKASANFFVPINSDVDFRFIGVELSYSKEFGDYADFRSALKKIPNYFTDATTDLFSGGLTSEVAWRGSRNPAIHYAVRGYFGTTFGNHALGNNFEVKHQYISDKFNPGASFFMQVKNYYFVFERQNLVNAGLRIGYSF